MLELETFPDRVRDPQAIVDLALTYSHLFTDYPTGEVRAPSIETPFDPLRDSEYEEDDRYHVLEMADMPRDLLLLVLSSLCGDTPSAPGFYMQINRYDQGDYVLPHRDSLQQGLYMLVTSDRDGLIVQSDPQTLTFVPDSAGTLVRHDPTAWHWVEPVRDAPRFTLVTIPVTPFAQPTDRGIAQ